jgi:hypothetical protein
MKEHETRAWATQIANVSLEWFSDKAAAMEAEAVAIKAESPEWNVHHRVNPKHEISRYHPDLCRDDLSTWVACKRQPA